MRDDDISSALRAAVIQVAVPAGAPATDVLREGRRRRTRRGLLTSLSLVAVVLGAAALLWDPSGSSVPSQLPAAAGVLGAAHLGNVVAMVLAVVTGVLTVAVLGIAAWRRSDVEARVLRGVVLVALGSALFGIADLLVYRSLLVYGASWRPSYLVLVAVGPCVLMPLVCLWSIVRPRGFRGLAGALAVLAALIGTPLWFLPGTPFWWALEGYPLPSTPGFFLVAAGITLTLGMLQLRSGVHRLAVVKPDRRLVRLTVVLTVIVSVALSVLAIGPRMAAMRVGLGGAALTGGTIAILVVGAIGVVAVLASCLTLTVTATSIAVRPRELPRAAAWFVVAGSLLGVVDFWYAARAQGVVGLLAAFAVPALLLAVLGLWLWRHPVSAALDAAIAEESTATS